MEESNRFISAQEFDKGKMMFLNQFLSKLRDAMIMSLTSTSKSSSLENKLLLNSFETEHFSVLKDL